MGPSLNVSSELDQEREDQDAGDQFGAVFQRREFRAVALTLWLLIQVAGNFLLAAIVCGIQSLHNKTLLHLMYLRICLVSVLYNAVPLNINVLRFLVGPLPGLLCTFNNLGKVSKGKEYIENRKGHLY